MPSSPVIKKIEKVEVFSDKFSKQTVVISDDSGKYPNLYAVEFANHEADRLVGFAEGEEVTVSFFINGREWTNPEGVVKYFMTLRGRGIEKAQKKNFTPPPQPKLEKPEVAPDESDDLPF